MIEKSKVELSDFTTEELMQELSKRQGVQTFEIAENAEVMLEVRNCVKYAGIGSSHNNYEDQIGGNMIYDLNPLKTRLKEKLKRMADAIIDEKVKENVGNRRVVFFYNADDHAGVSYVKSKDKILTELGITTHSYDVSKCTPDQIKGLESDAWLMGIPCMFQRPMKTSEQEKVASELLPEVDIDALHPRSSLTQCTVWAVAEIIKDYLNISDEYWNKPKPLAGVTIAVVGRGKLIGRRLCDVLLDKGATLFALNSSTGAGDRRIALTYADIIVLCADNVCFTDNDAQCTTTASHKLIIDCGIIRGADGKIQGCISKDFDANKYFSLKVTPVPGGVGPLTVLGVAYNSLMLMELQTYRAIKADTVDLFDLGD